MVWVSASDMTDMSIGQFGSDVSQGVREDNLGCAAVWCWGGYLVDEAVDLTHHRRRRILLSTTTNKVCERNEVHEVTKFVHEVKFKFTKFVRGSA